MTTPSASSRPDLMAALATEWAKARSECVAEPIGSSGYRAKLNRLSNAEDALSRAALASEPEPQPVADARAIVSNLLMVCDANGLRKLPFITDARAWLAASPHLAEEPKP